MLAMALLLHGGLLGGMGAAPQGWCWCPKSLLNSNPNGGCHVNSRGDSEAAQQHAAAYICSATRRRQLQATTSESHCGRPAAPERECLLVRTTNYLLRKILMYNRDSESIRIEIPYDSEF